MRILVADDFGPWRQFNIALMQQKPGWDIVCEAADGLEAVRKTEELQPDLILLDIGLPKLNGIEAARRIRELAPNSKILLVSTHDDVEFVEEALSTGASGYVFKADAGGELLQAVETVMQGKRFVSRRLKRIIPAEAEETQAPAALGCGHVLASPAPPVPQKTLVSQFEKSTETSLLTEDVLDGRASMRAKENAMTFERRIVVSLDEIAAVVLECTRCGAKSVSAPEHMTLPPAFCPNGHGWNWNVQSELTETGAPLVAWVLSLNRLRLRDVPQAYGFKVFLEFKDPTK